jgi:Na+/H+-dicarboxylate symporter
MLLTVLILVGLVAGAAVGEWLFQRYDGNVPGSIVDTFDFIGRTCFVNLLKMVLVPLVVSSVIVGVTSVGDPADLGWLGLWTVVYYVATMLIAVILGVVLVTTIQPGSGFETAFRDKQVEQFEATEGTAQERTQSASGTGLWGACQNIVKQMIPTNPLGSAAKGQLLPVISFCIMFGIAMTFVGEKSRALREFFEALFAATMQLVEWILWLAPIGVFALLVWTVSRIGLVTLAGPLAKFVATVLIGLSIHGLIILPLVLIVFGRANPISYFFAMKAALLTALGTDSSSATLPVTLDCAEGEGGCSRRAARFVLPLGATINMDGTALYEAVTVVFLFQCFGIELGATELAIIVLTSTLAAIGAAGIPSAGLVTMVIVLEAVNSSLGGDKMVPISAVGIIWGIDRLLDMCRTVVNVWGDAVGARILSRLAPDPE